MPVRRPEDARCPELERVALLHLDEEDVFGSGRSPTLARSFRATTAARVTAGLLWMLLTFVMSASTARAETEAAGPRTELWAGILDRRVNADGEVAYRALAAFDTARLADYVASLAAADLSEMDREERVALWINAYNAGVVAAILEGGDPETLAGRARLYHWFELEVAGRTVTLDDIDHELRGYAAADPRIYFALSNGTRGAPPLVSEPYRAPQLEAQLERAARRFLRDPRWNRVDVPARRAELSEILSWYESDFERDGGSVLGFVARFAEHPKVAAILRRPEMTASYRRFEWSLNAAPGEHPHGPDRAARSR
jgi:hypothetical protein